MNLLTMKSHFQRSVPVYTLCVLSTDTYLQRVLRLSFFLCLFLQDGNIPDQAFLTRVFISQHTYQITLKGGLFVKCLRGRLTHVFYLQLGNLILQAKITKSYVISSSIKPIFQEGHQSKSLNWSK